MIKFIKYLLRWQLSGIVLAPVLSLMTNSPLWDVGVILATATANLIGACVFFWVDKKIFNEKKE